MSSRALEKRRKERQAERSECVQNLLDAADKYPDKNLCEAVGKAVELLRRYETTVCELESRLFW